jgi:tight adherence protein C
VTATALLAAVAAALATVGGADVLATRRPRARDHGPRRALVRAVGALGRRLGGRPPASLAALIDAAGLRTPVRDVMAVKAGAAPAAFAAALPSASLAPGRLGLFLLVGAPLAGFLAPDVWLHRRARRRARAMGEELADVLELLRVAVGAGLSPRRALAEVARRHPGLLAAELGAAADRTALGVPFGEALERMGRRAPAPGVPALVAALQRAERLGAPPGDALAALTADARGRAARRAAEHAAKAAPKIQLVVALLLVPSVLLLVLAAIVPALGSF